MENRLEKNTFIFRLLSIFLIVCIIFADILLINPEIISAASGSGKKNEKKFGFTQTKISLCVGNTFQLKTVGNDTDSGRRVEYRSSDENVVLVSQGGFLRAVGEGKADIIADYIGQSAACHINVKKNDCKLSETEIILYEGQTTIITLTSAKQKAVKYSYFLSRQEDDLKKESWDDEIELEESLWVDATEGNGTFMIQGMTPGKYYLDLSLTNEKKESFSARCKVEVLACGFESYGIGISKGKTISVAPENGEIISCRIIGDGKLAQEEKGVKRWGQEWDEEWYDINDSTEKYYEKEYQWNEWEDEWEDDWKSPEEEVVYDGEIQIDDKGNVTGIRPGRTRIVIDWRTAYGKVRQDWISIDVTTPEYIPFDTPILAINKYGFFEKYTPKFTGLGPYSKIVTTSSDEDVIALEDTFMEYNWEFHETQRPELYPQKSGTATVKFVVDGVTFQQKIQVIAVEVQEYFLVKKGKQREQVLISGLPKDCKVTWKIADKKIASISKEGKVKGKKVGSTEITATIGGTSVSGIVIVGDGKGTEAVLKGEKVIGSKYSQEKRMQKGYYDCSSFVWRSYNAAGLKLCGVNYAPTAAELAKKLEAEGKVIAYGSMDVEKLKPGDLIFTGGNPGRYKNIGHVDMCYGVLNFSEYGGIVALLGAGPGGGVGLDYVYWENDDDCVMIARPVQ